MNVTDKKITIIGAKRSGRALARLVTRLNGRAKISEQDGDDCLTHEFKDWALQQMIEFEFNGHTKKFIEDSDMIVLSPGVRRNALPIRWAKAKNIPVLGEIEFASQFCSKPIIAVTGSNGKTTVATLISKVLQTDGHQVCLCGNVGFPFSGLVLDLDKIDYVVLEISSFQLESVLDPMSPYRNPAYDQDLQVRGFKPHIAVILNITQNHLDRHKDLEEYFAAKKRVFLNQNVDDFIVLNYEDPQMHQLSSQIKSRIIYFNVTGNDLRITNPNYLAVLEVGRILGVDEHSCRNVFQGFGGVEHRLEKVRSLNGVDFINDSKATTAEAALWALKSIDRPVVMICGGRDKNIDFSVLTKPVQQKVKKMYVIGEARQKIREVFDEFIKLEECEGLEDAVVKAKQNASKGDCVLLSPMCASFDMFADFEERGRMFKEIVNNLI